MEEISVLIGGKAGFGIDKSGTVIASILKDLGRQIYIYRDYPSLIRGGHTFSIIRAAAEKVTAHKDKVDLLVALNQDALDLHKFRLKDNSVLIYDSDTVKPGTAFSGARSFGVALAGIIKEERGQEIMRNICLVGALVKVLGIDWTLAEKTLRKNFSKEADMNIKIARRGYDVVAVLETIKPVNKPSMPILSGNEALALGLVNGGLDAYLAYPMTPSSPILHYLAGIADEFNLKVVHPESEISVILMALGFSYVGKKVAVGTSGGGFCLMTEGLSFAGMAELPVVVILGQRPGPSTGLPTYSTQTELHFALNAGQGEFPRFLVAPGDAEEAYYWAGVAMNLSWKFQIPSIILTDKTMGEGAYSFDMSCLSSVKEESIPLWDKVGQYKRYLNTDTGVSPLAFVPDKKAVIKVNSYEHDEAGITTEDTAETVKMQDKRLKKEGLLKKELLNYGTVNMYGNKDSEICLLCWGSNKGVCEEVARELNIRMVQVAVLSPFPLENLKRALDGVNKIIAVENNATAQLVKLINSFGLAAHDVILKYDGRPFSVEELTNRVKGVIKWQN